MPTKPYLTDHIALDTAGQKDIETGRSSISFRVAATGFDRDSSDRPTFTGKDNTAYLWVEIDDAAAVVLFPGETVRVSESRRARLSWPAQAGVTAMMVYAHSDEFEIDQREASL